MCEFGKILNDDRKKIISKDLMITVEITLMVQLSFLVQSPKKIGKKIDNCRWTQWITRGRDISICSLPYPNGKVFDNGSLPLTKVDKSSLPLNKVDNSWQRHFNMFASLSSMYVLHGQITEGTCARSHLKKKIKIQKTKWSDEKA